ncbi:MAG: glycosyltransferase family 1 protein [Flavobacteriaceae bacterium]
MKILLLGEYSNLHNSLKQALINMGHEVLLVGNGDGFKKYETDVLIKSHLSEYWLFNVIARLLIRIFNINIFNIEIYFRAKKLINKFHGFDVVQLINENSFKTSPLLEIKLLKQIFKNNKNVFLLSCGVDSVSVKYAMSKKLKYSILTPLFEDASLEKKFESILKYDRENFLALGKFVQKNVKGIISSDLDYHIPYSNKKKYLGMIPNPINTQKIKYYGINKSKKISILHAINSSNKIKKGNRFFEEALQIIDKKFKGKVNIITTYDLPYKEHLENLKKCDILLDMVYAYDQGYNALEAMAMGKIVFTGAEEEWLNLYNIKADTVVINAIPDTARIVKKLFWLIQNPKMLKSISLNARKFIEKNHDFEKIATKYIKTWEG